MMTKTFDYKGQMINYYNKVRKNSKVKMCWCGWFSDTMAWTVQWTYN